ncbi:MAG: hypothetical protein H0T89_34865 [Deltaproteobacteria bacterium]|nr:hypothetical protein [Deltaproteobacteria bacterium]MDQ3297520.1 hypothetical protein [Myxococcota bacterium]
MSRVDKGTVHTTTGAVGAAGKTTKRTHKDEWRARGDQRGQLAEYLKKGYRHVLRGKPPKQPAIGATNAQLEAQLKKGPSDQAFAVMRTGCKSTARCAASSPRCSRARRQTR